MAPETVLIIEDNPTNQKLFETLLRRGGFISLIAADGESGVEIAERIKPDLILMDIQLPKMDGLEATRVLRAQPEFHQTPIVALTGRVYADECDGILAAGCDGVITKPIDTRFFIQQVRTFLKSQP